VSLVDFVLSILDVLLIFLDSVYVEKIILLKCHKFLVQLLSILKEKIILIELLRQLNQIKTQKLLETSFQPSISVIRPINFLRSRLSCWSTSPVCMCRSVSRAFMEQQ